MAQRRVIILAVRDFALPVPRVGSIELYSGYGRAPEEGQAIHLKVQEERIMAHSNYRPEVFFRRELTRDKFRFQVGGRMDGIFAADPPEVPIIEEIKTAFSVDELAKKLEAAADTHPYCLQLKTYGYFHWLDKQVVPRLTFHLVSTRNGAERDIELELDLGAYEKWLDLRLDELVEEAKKCEARAKRRRKVAKGLTFPFERPRPGQTELIEFVEQGMKSKSRMLIQAPTGLGKTVGVLFPTLKQALDRGQNVIYVTPKNSQHLVAEDAVTRLRETGANVRSLTLTAKGKICFKPEPLCHPDFCEYAKDHYEKVQRDGLADLLSKKRKLGYRAFRKLGEDHQVCPFELQMEAVKDADTVICDYNYVFSPHSLIGKLGGATLGQQGNPNLVIDEAHNLLARGLDYYSPAVSTPVLERMRPSIREIPERFRRDAESLLDEAIATITSCRPEKMTKNTKINPPTEPFLEQDAKLRQLLTRYLESDAEIFPKDPILKLCFYWGEFTGALEYVNGDRPEFFTTYQEGPAGGTVKITCCDASEMLRETYDAFDQIVGFSATLKPFDYYAKLSGLDPESLKTGEFQSPFPKSRRKILIIPQLSTKYSDRSRNYPKVAEAIARIAAVRPGNYFAFFPSFDFLDKVHNLFEPPPGFTKLRQEREMRLPAVHAIMDHLREATSPTIVFAVQGGVFSEGVDYPGETIIGAFVVGPPLPIFDLEREAMREYYQEKYGAGFDYAYAFPAMAKAVQAAGRVIRSETDRGLIVLMDNRFLQPSYTRSMPSDWFDAKAAELVSGRIIEDVSKFWESDSEPA